MWEEFLAFGAGVAIGFGSALEVVFGETFVFLWACFADVFFTPVVAFVAVAVVWVRDDGVELVFGAGFEVGLAVVVGVGEEFAALIEVIAEPGLAGL